MNRIDVASFGGAGGRRAGEARRSRLRRVVMFPLTRILIAAGLFVGLQVAIGLGSELLPSSWQGALLTQALSALIALAIFALLTLAIERRSLAENGLRRTSALRHVALGVVGGAAIISIVVGILAAAGWYAAGPAAAASGGAAALLWRGALLFLLVAVAEEVLFRGVLFRVLEEGIGTWLALGVTAVLFGFLHLINDNASLLGAIGAALAGVILGAAFVLTRDLWLAIGIHWAWNFTQGTLYGLPVSGRDAGGSLLDATIHGPALWTGGAFGPEAALASIIVTGVVGASMLLWIGSPLGVKGA